MFTVISTSIIHNLIHGRIHGGCRIHGGRIHIIHHIIQSIIQKWTKWGWVGYAQGKVQKRSPYKDGRSCKHLKAALIVT